MAPGDRTRKWFPQAVELLRNRYHSAISPVDLISMTKELNHLVDSIRSSQGILPPKPAKCTNCGDHSMVMDLTISVNAAIVALERFKIADETHVAQLQADWLRHRKRNGLDRRGAAAGPKRKHVHHHHAVKIEHAREQPLTPNDAAAISAAEAKRARRRERLLHQGKQHVH